MANAPESRRESVRTVKLRNHHLTLAVWPEGGRILEVVSLRTGRHLVSWWPFKIEAPERAGGIGERSIPFSAGPYVSKEFPDRILMTKDLPGGLSLKKTIYLPADSLVFHVSFVLTNNSDAPKTHVLDQTAALCPGFGGPMPRAESGILHCRHKAFLKRPEEIPEEIAYEVFERVHVERDDVEWAMLTDPVTDNLICAILPKGHVALESEYHWWLNWSHEARLASGASFTADFHYACAGSVDVPLVAGEHFVGGLVGDGAPLAEESALNARISGLDTPSAGTPVSIRVDGKEISAGKPLPEGREALVVALPKWSTKRDLAVEMALGGKYGSAELSARECRALYAKLDEACGEALAAADAGKMSSAKAATVLAYRRIVEVNRDKCARHLPAVIENALRSAQAVIASPREAVEFYGEAQCRWQMKAAREVDEKKTGQRLTAALSGDFDLSMPRFREPHAEAGAFALSRALLETALWLSVHRDNDIVHLFKTRLAELTATWARFGAVFYETIHHGVLLSRLIPAYAIASQQGWLSRADEIETQAMILDLCGKIRRQGGMQFRLSNWWAMESAGPAYAGALFPYIPEAGEYLSRARETFYWLLVHGTMSDGGFWEMSPSYHMVTLEYLAHIAEAFLRTGEDLFAGAICGRRLSEMAEFVKAVAAPPGRLPAFDDSGRELPAEATYGLAKRLRDGELLYHAEAAFERARRPKDVWRLFVPVDAPESVTPNRGSQALEGSGKLVLRSACGNVTLVLDFGPHGGWHGHNDKLSFELFWRDVCIVPDAGTYRYEDALHWTWFKTSAAHNTVTLGDDDQLACAGRFWYIFEGGGFVTAAVSASTYPKMMHRREVTIGERALLIDDYIENAPAGETIVWRMNSFVPIALEGSTARLDRRGVKVTLTQIAKDVEMSVAEVALVGEEESSDREYVQGWQLRMTKRVTREWERFLTRIDFEW